MQKNKQFYINQKNLLEIIQNNTFSWKDTFMMQDSTLDNRDNIDESVFFSINENDVKTTAIIEHVKNVLSEKLTDLLNRSPYFNIKTLNLAIGKNPHIKQSLENQDIIDKVIAGYGHDVPNYGLNKQFEHIDIEYGILRSKTQSNDIIHLGPIEFGLFTTREELEEEVEVIKMLLDVNPNHQFALPKEIVNEKINLNSRISTEQINAVRACAESSSQVSGCFGLAGAGKSTTMNVIVQAYKEMGYTPVGIALSWLAAKVLEIETSMECHSIEKFIRSKEDLGDKAFDKPTLLIVDEAGLNNIEYLKRTLKIIKSSKYPIKLILSGDPTQLNPINGANSLELVEKILPKSAQANITEIRRQNSKSNRDIVKMLRDGRSGEALYILNQQNSIHITNNQSDMLQRAIQDAFTALNENRNDPDFSIILLAMNHKVIYEGNQKMRQVMIDLGKVDTKTEIEIPVKRKNPSIPPTEKFAVGDKICFLKNDSNKFLKDVRTDEEYKVFLSNNSTGEIKSIKSSANGGYDIRVHMQIENDRREKVTAYVDINTKDYVDKNLECCIGLNYATVAYASQGQTVKQCFFLDDGAAMMHRRYAYVVCSRHKEKINIYINREKITNEIIAERDKQEERRQKQEKIEGKEITDSFEERQKKRSQITTIDILNKVGKNWGKLHEQKSIIIRFLEIMNDIKQIKKNNPEFSQLDLYNLPENFMVEYQKYQNQKRLKELQKTYYQPPKDQNMIIFDTPEYYSKKSDVVNIEFKDTYKGKEHNYSFQKMPVKEKPTYHLSNLINEEIFTQLQGDYLDIGSGGQIAFIAKTRDIHSNHVIISKYNMFGEDSLGIGYPFFINGGNESKNGNKIIIIEDINEFLSYMKNYYLDSHNYLHSPTLIWGTKDINYSHILKRFDNSEVFLIGSENFKETHYDKIMNSIEGHRIHNIQFQNFNNETPILNILSKIRQIEQNEGKLVEHIEETPINYKINDNTIESNLFCNQYGELNLDFLSRTLSDKKILTQEQIQKHVLRSFNKHNNENIIDIHLNDSDNIIKQDTTEIPMMYKNPNSVVDVTVKVDNSSITSKIKQKLSNLF